MRPIKLSLPELAGNEKKYCNEAIESTWITPLGPFVDRFEKDLENWLPTGHVVALSSGTAAIHLALADAGVTKGDKVICQSMTFAASANPIVYLGADPVFVDSEYDTWNMSPELLKKAITQLSEKPKAIIVTDLYGMPAKHDGIRAIADEAGITVIEDSAEAIGSRYKGKHSGLQGDYGVLSFNGNKMITTSGGGALIVPSLKSAKHVLHLATQARESTTEYFHKEIGYNYRLSNISAAIGCAQLEDLDRRVKRRKAIHRLYTELLSDCKYIEVKQNPNCDFDSNFWLTTILLSEDSPLSPLQLCERLKELNIETRRLWRPMHTQPIYANAISFLDGTSEDLFARGLCLPSSTTLSDDEIKYVASEIKRLIEEID